jgi:hypothetical protein
VPWPQGYLHIAASLVDQLLDGRDLRMICGLWRRGGPPRRGKLAQHLAYASGELGPLWIVGLGRRRASLGIDDESDRCKRNDQAGPQEAYVPEKNARQNNAWPETTHSLPCVTFFYIHSAPTGELSGKRCRKNFQ